MQTNQKILFSDNYYRLASWKLSELYIKLEIGFSVKSQCSLDYDLLNKPINFSNFPRIRVSVSAG